MSTIAAANSSAASALASLLSNSASSADAGTLVAGTPAAKVTSEPAASSSSRDPVDILDLSDHAKAVLERAKIDQVVADRLAALVEAAKNPDGKGTDRNGTATKTDAAGSSLFDKLAGPASSGPTGEASGKTKDGGDYMVALIEAHRQPDGTVESFTLRKSDFLTVPSADE